MAGFELAVKSFGAFVGINLVDVLVDGLEILPISGFSCFMDALDNNGAEAPNHSPLMARVNEDSKNKTKKQIRIHNGI